MKPITGLTKLAFTLGAAGMLGGLALAFQTQQPFRPDDKQGPPVFRAAVDMVVIPVTVTDRLNRYVTDLEKQDFRLYEDKVEQEITYFSTGTSPISVGFILDISGSMADNVLSARNSIIRFLEKGDTEDEYFLVTFNNRTALAQDFTPRGTDVRDHLVFANPKGSTALFDGVFVGLEKMKQAKYPKRALIVVTDGEDNSSRYTYAEVKDLARESSVLIYVIGERGEVGYGPAIISELVKLTGGRPFFPTTLQQLDYFADLISVELRSQYVLGYHSSNRNTDGLWRDVRVQLNPREDLPKLKLRYKPGYIPAKF